MASSSVLRVSMEVLKYLVKNPDAMDTIEGIVRFWILRQRIELHVQEVEEAVSDLIRRGFLKERVVHDAAANSDVRCFQVDKDRMSEIDLFLRQHNVTDEA